MKKSVTLKLEALADEKNKKFAEKLIFTKYEILGLKTPAFDGLIKSLTDEEKKSIIEDIDSYNYRYYEEVALTGLMICKLKCGYTELETYVRKYVALIDNWALCDTFFCKLKIVKKFKNEYFNLIKEFLKSDKEYVLRSAIISLLCYYVDEEHLPFLFDTFNTVQCDAYYVKMAIAWTVSVCFVKFPDKTKVFLAKNDMPVFTQNKSISKIRESLRVSAEDKQFILQFKK